jgi:hypothetical protein
MGRHPFRNTPAAALRLAHALQHQEHVRHLTHVVRGTLHVAERQIVGLPLRIATIAQKQDAQSLRREIGDAAI